MSRKQGALAAAPRAVDAMAAIPSAAAATMAPRPLHRWVWGYAKWLACQAISCCMAAPLSIFVLLNFISRWALLLASGWWQPTVIYAHNCE